MSIKTRLRLLESHESVSPRCTCPGITDHFEQPDGTIFPPFPPCLRADARCPESGREPRSVKHLIFAHSRHSDGAAPDELEPYDLDPCRFTLFDPATNGPRVQIIVWRDSAGKLVYHGPPRWWEMAITPPALIVRG